MINIIISIAGSVLTCGIAFLVYTLRQEGKLEMCKLEISNLKTDMKDYKIFNEKIWDVINNIDKKLERVITIIEINGGEKNDKN